MNFRDTFAAAGCDIDKIVGLDYSTGGILLGFYNRWNAYLRDFQKRLDFHEHNIRNACGMKISVGACSWIMEPLAAELGSLTFDHKTILPAVAQHLASVGMSSNAVAGNFPGFASYKAGVERASRTVALHCHVHDARIEEFIAQLADLRIFVERMGQDFSDGEFGPAWQRCGDSNPLRHTMLHAANELRDIVGTCPQLFASLDHIIGNFKTLRDHTGNFAAAVSSRAYQPAYLPLENIRLEAPILS